MTEVRRNKRAKGERRARGLITRTCDRRLGRDDRAQSIGGAKRLYTKEEGKPLIRAHGETGCEAEADIERLVVGAWQAGILLYGWGSQICARSGGCHPLCCHYDAILI